MDEIGQQAWEEMLGAAERRLALARTLLHRDLEAAEREIAVAERLLDAARDALLAPTALEPAPLDPDAPFAIEYGTIDEAFFEPLTPREIEVLHLVAAGLRNKEIAVRLGVSERTATFHVGNVLAKLGADSRTEAVHFARRRGLLRD